MCIRDRRRRAVGVGKAQRGRSARLERLDLEPPVLRIRARLVQQPVALHVELVQPGQQPAVRLGGARHPG
eukprot:6092400-Prymnesium_polylepis.1